MKMNKIEQAEDQTALHTDEEFNGEDFERANVEPSAPEQAVDLVQMVRDDSFPEPHSALVHHQEVDNYRLGGWTNAD